MTTWTLKAAQERVGELVEDILTQDDYIANRALVELHDHWRDGESWVGPRGASTGVWNVLKDRIEPQFTPSGATEEAVGRWVNALVKTQADVQFRARVPGATDDEGEPEMTEEQEKRAAEIRLACNSWWDRVSLWEDVRTAARRSRWSGRGVLRARIPDGVRVESTSEQRDETGEAISVTVATLPSGLTLADALRKVDVSAEESNAAGVYIDPDTLKASGLFLYNDAANKERGQVWELGETGELTVRDLGTDTTEPVAVAGATRLPIVEMRAELLVTETVRREQKRLDFLETLVTRNGETASFPERYTTNAQPQGVWVPSVAPDVKPLAEEVFNGTTFYLIEVPLTIGASTVVQLRGFPYDLDNEGRKGVTTPGVHRFEPVHPAYAIDPAVHAYAVLMRNCHQGHVLAAEAAQRSGFSIEQARADFETDVEKGRGPVEGLIAGIIEAALSLAGAMSEEARQVLAEYEPVVTLHVDTGPRSVAERTQDAADVAAGLMSDETAMLRRGEEDVQAERARIAASPAGAHAAAERQWTLAKIIGEATGFDNVTCAVLAGVSEEQIAEALEVSRRLNAPAADPATNGNGNGSRIPVLTQ